MWIYLVSLIVVLIGHLVWRRYKLFQILWEAGHVGPRGNLISGNYYDISRQGSHVMFDKWFKEYKSDVVGFYYGSQPFLAIKDRDLIKQILIKDFAKFKNRVQALRWEAAHPVIGSQLIFAADQRWKSTRNFMTPSFSTVNMREMYSRSLKCTDSFMNNLKAGVSLEMYSITRRYTLDNISLSAFSVVSNVQKDLDGPMPKFQEAAENGIDKLGTVWLSRFVQFFKPLGRLVFSGLRPLNLAEHPQDNMIKFMEHFVKIRETQRLDSDWVDFMQNLLNAEKGESSEKRAFHKSLDFQLTKNETIGNCLLFFNAAFETTSSALCFLLYLLGQEPQIQERLRKELKSAIEESSSKTLEYDIVMNNRYLDMVISEALRIYPTGNGFLGREANEDFEYKGVKIPAGVDVIIPAYNIHRDPEIYPDPEKFDPERFSPENRGKIPSMAYLPFGEGQRACIGNRFALMQMKLALARISLKYNFELNREKHQQPLDIKERALILLQPLNGVHVVFSEV